MNHVLILGAGQAGAALATRLRSLGHDGPITLVGEEDAPPYQRPPLSKKYLLGEMSRENLFLRPERFYADQGITLHRGRRATRIDRDRRRVDLGGEWLGYDHLVLTTGTRPRSLPAAMGGDPALIHTLRGLADIDRLAPEMRPGRRVLIVGGGYIGLEAAAIASRQGLDVTLIEAAPRILQRVAGPETAAFFRELHRGHGVEILEGIGLTALHPGAPLAAELSDGTRHEFDFIVLGIGVVANDELAAAAGLECDGGIVVDARGRTSDPHIWAAGDCTRLPLDGRMIRLECVQNAIDQAEAVAANIMGARQDYHPKPWFWSDQHDIKLQIAGLSDGHDSVITRPGATGRSHWYFAKGRLIAVDAMNDPRAYMIGKRLIEAGRSPLPAQLGDAALDLKTLL